MNLEAERVAMLELMRKSCISSRIVLAEQSWPKGLQKLIWYPSNNVFVLSLKIGPDCEETNYSTLEDAVNGWFEFCTNPGEIARNHSNEMR